MRTMSLTGLQILHGCLCCERRTVCSLDAAANAAATDCAWPGMADSGLPSFNLSTRSFRLRSSSSFSACRPSTSFCSAAVAIESAEETAAAGAGGVVATAVVVAVTALPAAASSAAGTAAPAVAVAGGAAAFFISSICNCSTEIFFAISACFSSTSLMSALSAIFFSTSLSAAFVAARTGSRALLAATRDSPCATRRSHGRITLSST